MAESAPLDPQAAAYLRQQSDIELAQRHLECFCEQVIPGFESRPYTRRIIRLLERIERGEVQKAIVMAPPGSGKSTICAAGIAWYLGRQPRRRVILASSVQELAMRNSGWVRDTVAHELWPFETRLAFDSQARHRWGMEPGGGGAFAVGAMGSITGWRGTLAWLDDVQTPEMGDAEIAQLPSWFGGTLVPRLDPPRSILIVATRVREDDLIGHILSGPRASEWEVLCMPALGEMGDLLYQPLWPQEVLDRLRDDMTERNFSAQFLCNPLPQVGSTFRVNSVKRYTELPDMERRVIGIDCAAKLGVGTDWSVICVVGVSETAYHVLDVIRRKVEFPALLDLVQTAAVAYTPSAIYCEDASAGQQLVQVLRESTRLPVVGCKPKGRSKEMRADLVTPLFAAGKVFLPERASWLPVFEHELFAFPNGKTDDQVDALVWALLSDSRPRSYPISFAKIETRVPSKGFDRLGRLWDDSWWGRGHF
jgi:predicted phage terminase large subunit-like protein